MVRLSQKSRKLRDYTMNKENMVCEDCGMDRRCDKHYDGFTIENQTQGCGEIEEFKNELLDYLWKETTLPKNEYANVVEKINELLECQAKNEVGE